MSAQTSKAGAVRVAPVLEVRDLRVSYGGIEAVHGVSFDVREGEIVALVGANGAGKTSVLRGLSGMVRATGDVALNGRSLVGLAPDAVLRAGLAHVPEGRGVFPELTVEENLRLGAWLRKPGPELDRQYERVFTRFPRLRERLKQAAGTLSGGEQQMLAMGRALLCGARVLLLDEPSMGLSPRLTQEIFAVLRELNAEGFTLLLVEQNANQALRLAQRAHVLENGRIALSGTGRELLEDARVRDIYLGA